MRAALLLEYGSPLQVEEVEPASLGRRDARVRIDASGVCRTDLTAANGSLGRPLPLLLGREATGVVTDVGADVTRVAIGDRVVLSFVASCGDCEFCLRHETHLCGYLAVLAGVPKATRGDGSPVFATSALGTFAEEITAHETILVKVSTDLPSEELALIGCGVATGVGAVLNTAAVESGSSVAILGCGGVGQAVIQGARVAGAAEIFGVDPVPHKRDLALANGATRAIDPGDGDPVGQLLEATAGKGCDYAFEVLGTPATILQTLRATRRGGTSVVVGMPHPGDIIDLPATTGQRRMRPSTNERRTVTEILTMSLDDEMPWRADFPPDTESFYDDTGWSFTAETDELDVMVGNFIYNFQGGPKHPKSQWLADGYVINDLIVVAPKARRGEPMANNSFHRTAMNPADFHGYDELDVTRKDNAVIWRLGDIVYTCSPPTWHLGGRSGEATFDVHFRQQPSPVVWSYGTHQDAPKQGIGGGYCYVEGEGTITVGSQVLDIRNIAGVHERLCFSAGLDVIAQVGADTTGFGQGIAIHVLEGDVGVWALGSVNDLMFFLTVDGQHINYLPRHDGSVVTYTPLEPWHDRRSGLLMPTRWSVRCESAEGRLDLELAASARGYYPWDMKRGYQLMYWFLCIANGSFTYPDGRQVPIENRRAQHEIVRNIIVHQETFDGPILTPDH